MDDKPGLVGVDTPVKSAKKEKEKGKRISLLQAKFETTSGDASMVDEKDVKRTPMRRDSSKKLQQHWETIQW
jgi:hypothetical protein